MSEYTDFDDDYYDGHEQAFNKYYIKRSQRKSNYDRATIDIRADAPVIEFDSSIFAYCFGVDSASTFDPPSIDDLSITNEDKPEEFIQPRQSLVCCKPAIQSPRMNVDFDEITASNLTNPAIVMTNLDYFEKGVQDLTKERDRFTEYKIAINNDTNVTSNGSIVEPTYLTDPKDETIPFLDYKVELLNQTIETLTSDDYLLNKQKFTDRLGNIMTPPVPINEAFTGYSPTDISYLKMIMTLDETKFQPPDRFKVKIVYIPSAGGKTTMVQDSETPDRYFEVDDFVKKFYDRFKIAQDFNLRLKNTGSFMSNWFKYHLHSMAPDLHRKILLFNHPNQLPHYFRGYNNELIIIPVFHNWKLRFYGDNYFTLLGVHRKPKILASYEDYEYIISSFFRLF